MSSLFSLLYPAGASAAGFALLRLAVAAFVLVLQGAVAADSAAVVVGAWVVAAVLALGFLTRGVAAFAAACALLLWRQSGDANAGVLVVGALSALALALTGAGALSVDAYLFGRRVIELDE